MRKIPRFFIAIVCNMRFVLTSLRGRMMSRFSVLPHLCFPALLALSLAFPAIAQQGQYHLNYTPVPRPGINSTGSLATYAPIFEVYREMIQLRGDDGQVFSFNVDANTVFCSGEMRVTDWTYLKSVKKKKSVTVLTLDEDSTKAAVVWDQPPSISISDGRIVFALPAMCK